MKLNLSVFLLRFLAPSPQLNVEMLFGVTLFLFCFARFATPGASTLNWGEGVKDTTYVKFYRGLSELTPNSDPGTANHTHTQERERERERKQKYTTRVE